MAIDSVMGQTYPNIELTVFDDGSTDRTAEKIQECCSRYGEKIRFIQQENKGLVKTLNSGIKLSKGKYWCQLASDDLMDKDNIRKKVNFLQRNEEFDAVCSDALILRPDHSVSRMIPEKVKPDPLRIRKLRDAFAIKMFFPSLLLQKSVFDRIGKFDESMRYYEDKEMKIRLLLNCKVGYIDEPLMTWRLHDSNTSRTALFSRRDRMVAYEKIFTRPEAKGHWLLKRKLLGDEYYKYARSLIENAEKDRHHPVTWYLFRSLLLHPLRPAGYYYLVKHSFQSLLRR
jgi:glycosyltransferase involved in cell wall biosynthesis